MLPKQIKNHPSGNNPNECFRARVKYVCDKATTVKLINVTGDWESAAQQMAFTAGLNPRLRAPCCHLVCSWSETETHSDSDMIFAIEMVLQELGAGEHQTAIGIDRNRPSLHAHGAFSLVNPLSGATLSMSDSFKRLELACRKVEYRMGWPSDRGRFDVGMDDSEIVLIHKPASHWEHKALERAHGLRPVGRAAREQDRRTGRKHLRDTMTGERLDRLIVALDHANSWPVVHAALSRIGLVYQKFRSGARIVETLTQRHMPATGLGTRFGMRKMCEKLGTFVEATVALSLAKTTTPHLKLRKLKLKQKRERATMRMKLRGSKSPEAQAFRAILREDHIHEIKALRLTLSRGPSATKIETTESVLDRYSHALRQQISDLPRLDDHTARRQSWMLSNYYEASGVPEALKALTSSYPQTIRAVSKGDLLFAARLMDGSIASFDRLSLEAVPPKLMPATSALGVTTIGPQPANTCLLVRTSLDALKEMLQIDGPMPLVIVIGAGLDPVRKAHVEWLTRGRKIAIGTASFDDAPHMMDQLREMFPHAKDWGEAINITGDDLIELPSEVTDLSACGDIPPP